MIHETAARTPRSVVNGYSLLVCVCQAAVLHPAGALALSRFVVCIASASTPRSVCATSDALLARAL